MASGGQFDVSPDTRILDAARQTLADVQPPIDLGQQQDASIGGETAAIEGGVNRLAGNR